MAELHAPGWVAAGIREGLSATAALRDFRSAGGSLRDAVWYKLYAEQKTAVGSIINEVTAPLAAVPSAHEILPMTTKRATGYLQTIDVYTRIKGTDVVTTKPFMLTGQDLLSRGEAVARALTQMQTAVDEDRYEEVILGAVYTGTRIMAPGEVA